MMAARIRPASAARRGFLNDQFDPVSQSVSQPKRTLVKDLLVVRYNSPAHISAAIQVFS
jgi:hypothetical protein